MNGWRLTERAYSVSSLERFAVCPYQFFLAAIHRFEAREEPVALEQMDPLTRGAIFHRVLAEFLRALPASGALPVSKDKINSAWRLLDEVLNQVAQKYEDTLAPAIPRIWQDAIASMRTDLRGWLDRLVEGPAGWEPLHFEFGFGLRPDPNRDPVSVTKAATLQGSYLLRGVIDLIEKRQPTAGPAESRVTDYKTGRCRARPAMIVGNGELLQPLLYSLAVEGLTGQRVTEGRLYYCTSAGGFKEHAVKLNESSRRRATQVLEIIDRAIAHSFLPPAPREGACKTCDYIVVCGSREEARASEKDQEKLEQLIQLRGFL